MSINFVAPGIAIFENVLPEGESLMEDLEYSVESGILSWASAQVADAKEAGSENKYIRDTFSQLSL